MNPTTVDATATSVWSVFCDYRRALLTAGRTAATRAELFAYRNAATGAVQFQLRTPDGDLIELGTRHPASRYLTNAGRTH